MGSEIVLATYFSSPLRLPKQFQYIEPVSPQGLVATRNTFSTTSMVTPDGAPSLTFPVFWGVEPRIFLSVPAQRISTLIEEHLPFENRPLRVVAEGGNLPAAVPTAACDQARTTNRNILDCGPPANCITSPAALNS